MMVFMVVLPYLKARGGCGAPVVVMVVVEKGEMGWMVKGEIGE